ncbi:tautomerase family protein [Mesorhizobium argentiipisi]|uniref:Tautomerase family protein n=1 Tax=Mesorhizobium argentiipisi TaxID=3015175 RepID=A0ABU8KA43_9HYPH
MPIVRVELFPGRSSETKATIASEFTRILQDVAGIQPQETTVMFVEVQPSDWMVGGRPFPRSSPTVIRSDTVA